MFERFTDRARRVVVLAQDEARLQRHNYIGTEHLLLGLIREGGGVAGKVLTSFGLNLRIASNQVCDIIGEGNGSPSGHLPFTPRAKIVLQDALQESLNFGHNYINTEHLLLGLIHEGGGVGCQAMARQGLDIGRVRSKVIQAMNAANNLPGTEESPVEEPLARLVREAMTRAINNADQNDNEAEGTEQSINHLPSKVRSLSRTSRATHLDDSVYGYSLQVTQELTNNQEDRIVEFIEDLLS